MSENNSTDKDKIGTKTTTWLELILKYNSLLSTALLIIGGIWFFYKFQAYESPLNRENIRNIRQENERLQKMNLSSKKSPMMFIQKSNQMNLNESYLIRLTTEITNISDNECKNETMTYDVYTGDTVYREGEKILSLNLPSEEGGIRWSKAIITKKYELEKDEKGGVGILLPGEKITYAQSVQIRDEIASWICFKTTAHLKCESNPNEKTERTGYHIILLGDTKENMAWISSSNNRTMNHRVPPGYPVEDSFKFEPVMQTVF